jgi:2'-5' RNA ligase
MKRLFIAIDISEMARDIAAKHIASLRRQFPDLRVGWERPEKLHLTIKFLGRTGDEQLEGINKSLERIASRFQPFGLRLEGKGVFPSPRNARVLWLGVVDPEEKLAGLAEAVIDDMARLGFEPEKRAFKAHLTIARIKEPQSATQLAERHLQMQYEPVEFEIGDIVLYESQLHPTGSIYSKLAVFPLSRAV